MNPPFLLAKKNVTPQLFPPPTPPVKLLPVPNIKYMLPPLLTTITDGSGEILKFLRGQNIRGCTCVDICFKWNEPI